MLPLSLYVHFPWCVKKCPYCDFNSHETKVIPKAEYVNALMDDLRYEAAKVEGRKLHSIFFGGGTPSLFEAKYVGALLDEVERQIGFNDDIEITLEVNPGTSEYDNLAGYRAAGVNRLSFGVQSFDDIQLEKLGRIHRSAEVTKAVKDARKGGFDNINLDLMYGLSGQNAGQAQRDLQLAFDLEPEHISWYQLTIEPNTAFYSRPPTLPDDDALADIQVLGFDALAAAGYKQYEVSAYAKVGKESRHNLNYWMFGDYLAIGAGAHGKVTNSFTKFVQQAKNELEILRYRKSRKPADYIFQQGDKTLGNVRVNESSQILEFMMNSLRLVDGVPADLFFERTSLSHSAISELDGKIRELEEKGLMCDWPNRIQCTKLGFQFLNTVLGYFEG